ncbi:MAG: recombinase family protein [Clostridiales bacterium]|nr:recombinase family protein [Clostridiales bacterium]
MIALHELGVSDGDIFMDKQSGKDFNRPQYQKLLSMLKKRDVVYVKSIDRLGWNYEEILEQWRVITKKIGADIVVIDMQILDTRTDRNLMATFICDTVLSVLSFVAENERTNIKQRQAEGIAAAKARGVTFGRPCRPRPENFDEVADQWLAGEITCAEGAKRCGVPYSTFRQWAMHGRTGRHVTLLPGSR